MKKNDFAIFLVYVLMFALALLIGLFAIRPIVSQYGNAMPIHYIAVVVIALLVGVVLNAAILELGHLAGAKLGGYEVLSFIVLGFGVRKKDGKMKRGFYSFDGLTGETKVAPKDVEKASLGGYSFFPTLFYLVEVIALIIVNAVVAGKLKSDASLAWVQVLAITIISVGGMIFLYDIFPFRLDSLNDGFLIGLFTHEGNRIPYNYLLLQAKDKDEGKEPREIPVFDDITDFTAELNCYSVYRFIEKGDFDGAIAILDKTISQEKGVSARAQQQAACIKLALLLASSKTTVGKAYYEEFDDNQRKYIADMNSMPALRCYLLVSSCIEESEAEANYAIDKVEKTLQNVDPNFLEAEKALIAHDKEFVRKLHPTWDLYPLPWEEKKEDDEAEKEEK